MAPLPPPLPFAPSAASAPEVRTETVTPIPERDRTLAGVRPQRNPAAAHSVHTVRRAERKRNPHSEPEANAATSEFRHQGRRAIASSGKLGSFRASIGRDAGRLSPPEYDSAAGIENAAMPRCHRHELLCHIIPTVTLVRSGMATYQAIGIPGPNRGPLVYFAEQRRIACIMRHIHDALIPMLLIAGGK
jgi:hypothetical protein